MMGVEDNKVGMSYTVKALLLRLLIVCPFAFFLGTVIDAIEPEQGTPRHIAYAISYLIAFLLLWIVPRLVLGKRPRP
jgi:hypothetical protein